MAAAWGRLREDVVKARRPAEERSVKASHSPEAVVVPSARGVALEREAVVLALLAQVEPKVSAHAEPEEAQVEAVQPAPTVQPVAARGLPGPTGEARADDSPSAAVQQEAQEVLRGPWAVGREEVRQARQARLDLRNSWDHSAGEAAEARPVLRERAAQPRAGLRFQWKAGTHRCRSYRLDSHAPAS